MTDYESLVDSTVDEVKDRVRNEDLDLSRVLEAEKANKNRVTLVEWLESREDSTPQEELVEETTHEASFGNLTVRLNVVHALILAFVFGAMFGGLATGTVYQFTDTSTGAIVQDPSGNNDNTGNNGNTGPVDDTVDTSKISLEGEPVLGQSDAPVTMVIYEDFECPFCQRFEQGAMPQIVSNYVESGDVKVVWKDFPLPMHPWAKPGAAAMECVYRQDNDAFWSVKKQVFDNQNSLSVSNVQDKIKSWAAAEGVSESAVQSCLDNEDPMSEVEQDLQDGQNLGVSGTPTAIINGKKVVGALPYSAFSSVIEDELGN